MRQSYGLSLLLVATLVGGCDGQEQQTAAREQRQFQIVMETKLTQLEERTDALARDPADTVAVAHAGEIADLQRSQREFRAKVASLADAPESQWSEAKTILESEYLGLEKRYAELTDTVRQQSVIVNSDSLGMEGR
jgi:chlorite dismutase